MDTLPTHFACARPLAHVIAAGVVLLGGTLAVTSVTHHDTQPDQQDRLAAMSACRTWDAATSDGRLAMTVGSIAAVADDAILDAPKSTRAYFLTGFNNLDRMLATLTESADLADLASKEPELDTEVYVAFRDLSDALGVLHDRSAAGDVLDVARLRVPEVQRAQEAVADLCSPYVGSAGPEQSL